MKLNHKEFRVGNLVEYDGRVFEIDSVSEVLPTLNTIEFGIGVVDWNNLKPIPLNEDWLVRLPVGLVFPKWIKFVHTLQNWYWVENECEKELEFSV